MQNNLVIEEVSDEDLSLYLVWKYVECKALRRAMTPSEFRARAQAEERGEVWDNSVLLPISKRFHHYYLWLIQQDPVTIYRSYYRSAFRDDMVLRPSAKADEDWARYLLKTMFDSGVERVEGEPSVSAFSSWRQRLAREGIVDLRGYRKTSFEGSSPPFDLPFDSPRWADWPCRHSPQNPPVDPPKVKEADDSLPASRYTAAYHMLLALSDEKLDQAIELCRGASEILKSERHRLQEAEEESHASQ